MADLSAGLYGRLRDRSTNLKDRIKLLRYAWKSNQVAIANKEQTLINLVGEYLLGKGQHQLTEDDQGLVWLCLQDILQTKKAHCTNKQGQTLIVKQAVCQLITSTLAAAAKQTSNSGGSLSAVIGCCHAMMSSASFSAMFTSKLENMVDVMASLCQLLTKLCTKADDKGLKMSISNLLIVTTDKFLKAQRPAPNQNKILLSVVEHLLLPFLSLWKLHHDNTSTFDLAETTDQLAIALESCLFHRDHQGSYSMYLNALYGASESNKQSNKQLRKLMESLFNTFSKVADITALYVPKLFISFLKAECHQTNPITAHRMFVHCCHMIGVKSDSAAPCGAVETPAMIRGVKQLLETVQSQELYDVTQDESSQGRQLQFFRHLVTVLLGSKRLTADWYSSLTVLLQLNHHILETSLAAILSRGWIQISEKELSVVESGLEVFLRELFTTYLKLRQVPKLIRKILEAVQGSSENASLHMPQGLLKIYGEVTQSLPQGTTLEIWRLFIDNIRENYGSHLDPEKEDSEDVDPFIERRHFQGVCSLFHHYLMNVKVADYSVTAITANEVHELMVAMEANVLTPILVHCSDNKTSPALYPAMLLCHAWGELRLMLALYTKDRLSQLQEAEMWTNPGTGLVELSVVHSYLSSRVWKKVIKAVTKSAEKRLKYILSLLQVQTLRAYLLFAKTPSADSMSFTMDTLIDLPTEVSTEDRSATGCQSVHNLTDETYIPAKWDMLVSSLSVLNCLARSQHMASLARFLLQTVGSATETSKQGTLACSTKRLLDSDWVRESATLQCHLVSSLWQRILLCIQPKISSAKKRKSSSSISMTTSILTMLSDPEIQWDQDSPSVAGQLESVSRECSELLAASEVPLSLSLDLDSVTKYVQVLHRLPLESLSIVDKVRCLHGLILLLRIIKQLHPDPAGSDQTVPEQTSSNQITTLVSTCVDLLAVLLELGGTTHLPMMERTDIYVEWLRNLYCWKLVHADLNLRYKVQLVMEISCHWAVTNFQTLATLQPVLTQVAKQWKKQTGQEIKVNDLDTESMFLLGRCLQKELGKVLRKSYIKEDMKSSVQNNFYHLSEAAFQNASALKDSSGHLSISSSLIGCFTVAMTTKMEDEKGGKLKQSLQEHFDEIVDWCLTVLQLPQEVSNATHQMAALHFLFWCSVGSESLGETFTADHKVKIWTQLISVLKVLLVSQSDDRTSKTDQSDSLNCSISPGNVSSVEPMVQSDQEWGKQQGDSNSTLHSGLSSKQKIREHTSEPLNSNTLGVGAGQSGSSVVLLYRSLVFAGEWTGKSSKVILMQIQTVMAALVTSCDLDMFREVINDLLQDIRLDCMVQDQQRFLSAIFVWQQLLKFTLSEDQGREVRSASQNVIVAFQTILQQSAHSLPCSVVMTTLVAILQTQRQMLDCGTSLMEPQTAIMCLHSCQYVPLDGSTRLYVPVFHAVYEILNSLLINHTEAVCQAVPSFLSCGKRLLLSVMREASQDRVVMGTDVTDNLIGCAHQMERLFTLIATHKTSFSKVAMYVVSDYVTQAQQVTLLPAVKKALLPAVHAMLDLCDHHAISLLHAVLGQGVREVFKLLYSHYQKYHRYSGKV